MKTVINPNGLKVVQLNLYHSDVMSFMKKEDKHLILELWLVAGKYKIGICIRQSNSGQA